MIASSLVKCFLNEKNYFLLLLCKAKQPELFNFIIKSCFGY